MESEEVTDKTRANAIKFLFLTLVSGGNIIIDPSSIECVSEYEAVKSKKLFRCVHTTLKADGWAVTDTMDDILKQIEGLQPDEE